MLKKLFLKNRKIYYLAKSIKNINNENEIGFVLNDNNNIKFNFKRLGELYGDKFIYLYEQPNYRALAGFFAQYFHTLFVLFVADKFNLKPVIKFNDENLYSVGELNGISNVWEYYFMQPSEITVNDAYKSKNVFLSDESHFNFMEKIICNSVNGYNSFFNEEYIRELVQLHKKYIRVNTQVQEKINEEIEIIMGNTKKILGVHVRIGFRNLLAGHPVPIEESQFIKSIETAILQCGFEKIFLATDAEETITSFKNVFGDRIIYFSDIIRSPIGDYTQPQFSKSKRERHKYLLGIEVLRDAIALSRCDGLIAGISNVSQFAIVNKMVNNEQYEYVDILDNGIVSKNGADGIKYVNKMLRK
jgi:hypothetical protein